MQLGHWDLRNVLRGRNLRKSDHVAGPRTDRTLMPSTNRLYSERGDTQAPQPIRLHARRWPRTPSRSRRQAVRPDPPDASWIS